MTNEKKRYTDDNLDRRKCDDCISHGKVQTEIEDIREDLKEYLNCIQVLMTFMNQEIGKSLFKKWVIPIILPAFITIVFTLILSYFQLSSSAIANDINQHKIDSKEAQIKIENQFKEAQGKTDKQIEIMLNLTKSIENNVAVMKNTYELTAEQAKKERSSHENQINIHTMEIIELKTQMNQLMK